MYRKDGLVIVGVHTPEFAFETVPSNVRAAIKRLGVRYPVALDNEVRHLDRVRQPVLAGRVPDRPQRPHPPRPFRRGRVRRHRAARSACCSARSRRAGVRRTLADLTPAGPLTPESYLGYERLDRYTGSKIAPGQAGATTRSRRCSAQNELAYGGRLAVERAADRRRARTRGCGSASTRARSTSCSAARARVQVLVDGKPQRTVRGHRGPALHARRRRRSTTTRSLELRFSPGVEAYAFTFG